MTNTFLTPRLLDAIGMAQRVHGPMVRKGDGQPYVVHPMAVFGLLIKWGADEDTCIAGLLHDVIEDVPEKDKNTYRLEIKQKFGSNVLEIVEGVTEQDKSLPWKERKKLYLEHLKVASFSSLLVSCADKTHNTRSMLMALEKDGEEVWQRFNATKEEQKIQSALVLKTLQEHLDPRYTQELADNVKRIG